MHVTLHFLGDAEPSRTHEALRGVEAAAFRYDVDGVGRFVSPAGAVTLYARVAVSPGLAALHRGIASAPQPLGFRTEARPYAPHVTLGRFENGANEADVNAFLSRTARFPGQAAKRFSLYSSRLIDGAPRYARERTYALRPAPGLGIPDSTPSA